MYNKSWCISCYQDYYLERVGSGKRKSKIAIFRKITDSQMIILLTEISQKDIAKMYNLSVSAISLEITKRNLYGIKKIRRTRKVEFTPIKIDDTTSEDKLYSLNSWINSKERKSFINAGMMKNKSLSYELSI